jgi:hypothetical protein
MSMLAVGGNEPADGRIPLRHPWAIAEEPGGGEERAYVRFN